MTRKPTPSPFECKACGKVLSVSEFIENYCEACEKAKLAEKARASA
ncbi:hypothetical protein [Pararhizobium sp.]|nr:hypothetical protein [Pararhizobium sp.]MDO9417008.1 hypothetical protein [Pararhizobium sp.]